MKLQIVIPTYRRIKKLKRCLHSILANTYQDFKITVIADNRDFNTQNFVSQFKLQTNCSKIDAIVNDCHFYVAGSWNRFFREYHNEKWDGIVWLVDDVQLYPNCLENVVKCFKSNFSDLDGVVGISQCAPEHPNYTWMPYGQVLIGRKFIERYKEVNYQVCCVEYSHFCQDRELWKYAKSLNKFVLCKKAMLIHFHPGFYREEKDETHKLIRTPEIKGKDTQTYNLRKSKGLIWGQTWERVNDNKCF